MPKQRDKYYNITLYDAEKKELTGKGQCSKNLRIDQFTEEEAKKEIAKIRAEQRKKNLLYSLAKEKEKEEKAKVMSAETPKMETTINIANLPIRESEINIKFDANTGNTCVILGSSKMGKSTLLLHLYDKYYDSKEFISMLFTINPHINVYNNHKNLIMCKTFNRETEDIIKEQKYINMKTNNKYNFCNLLDDIIDVKYSSLLNNLILTYRNSNISTLISLQYPKLLNKSARANVNNIILFNFNTDETCIDAINLFLKAHFNKMGYKSEDDKLKLYKELTKNHGFIYINTLHNHISFHKLNI